jgi:photosystem II stability/assembly factor-like uncharacterized protein
MIRATVFLLLLLPGVAAGQVIQQQAGTDAEFRALHAAAAGVVWAGGQGGRYALTTDGGATWRADSIRGAGDLFITGIWAADARTAYALATHFDGGLARIYRTNDGGATWSVQWERAGDGVFMDALRCWDIERCVAFGDPVDGSLMVARTTDGGSWKELPADRLPALLEGEAGFAASGTTLATRQPTHAWIGTGVGARARVYRSSDGGASWTAHDTPLPGGATSGIFGVAFRDSLNGVAVGGDYQQRTAEQRNVIRTVDGGRTWTTVGTSQPHGVRYGVAYSPVTFRPVRTPGDTLRALVAVGPSGVGVSLDHGATWAALDGTHYNTVAFDADGTAWLGGPDGRVGVSTEAHWSHPPWHRRSRRRSSQPGSTSNSRGNRWSRTRWLDRVELRGPGRGVDPDHRDPGHVASRGGARRVHEGSRSRPRGSSSRSTRSAT